MKLRFTFFIVFVHRYILQRTVNLTRTIFEGARDRYSVRNVWSGRGCVYKCEQGDGHPTGIC